MRVVFIFIIFLFSGFKTIEAQNLIVNPGAELDPVTNGWTQVSGSWSGSNASFGEGVPHSGTYHFYSGDGQNSAPGVYLELYQDINVSAYATPIDGGTASFTFSFWTKNFGFNNDNARVYLEYRDIGGTVLSTYDSGLKTNFTSWLQYSDTRIAPVGTRTIRVRMLTSRITGTGADGYFDDFSLTTPISLPVSLLNFSAKETSSSIYIQWLTLCEKEEADYFYNLEKSSDGINWYFFKTKQGLSSITSTNQLYTEEDFSPIIGENYYRLSLIKSDNSITYFPIISCSFNVNENLFSVYPNPCPSNSELTIDVSEKTTLSIYSNSGDLIQSIMLDPGKTELNSLSLTPNNYFLEFNSGIHREVKTVIFE
jgi:hypothetical protein